jgi:hypothetical protein
MRTKIKIIPYFIKLLKHNCRGFSISLTRKRKIGIESFFNNFDGFVKNDDCVKKPSNREKG